MKDKNEMLNVIKTAQNIEREGLSFYKKSLQKVNDANSIGLLKFLINEEEQHLAYFMNLEKKIKGKIEKDKFKMKIIKSPLFSKNAYKKIGNKKTTTINIFNTALEMEEEGIKFYNKMARKIKDETIKKFLLSLANMEKKHFSLIKMHQDSIYNLWYWEAVEQPNLQS
jgi:rubrerythrin